MRTSFLRLAIKNSMGKPKRSKPRAPSPNAAAWAMAVTVTLALVHERLCGFCQCRACNRYGYGLCCWGLPLQQQITAARTTGNSCLCAPAGRHTPQITNNTRSTHNTRPAAWRSAWFVLGVWLAIKAFAGATASAGWRYPNARHLPPAPAHRTDPPAPSPAVWRHCGAPRPAQWPGPCASSPRQSQNRITLAVWPQSGYRFASQAR